MNEFVEDPSQFPNTSWDLKRALHLQGQAELIAKNCTRKENHWKSHPVDSIKRSTSSIQ